MFEKSGFTLSELLISLAILGVIATFTIPKVLQSQQSAEWKSGAKEAIGSISGVFQNLKLNGELDTATTPVDFSQYLNYVAVYSDGRVIDEAPPYDSRPCDEWKPCLQLHNGAYLHLMDTQFAGANTTNTISFNYDPDGVYSGAATGPTKSLSIRLSYNGRIRTSESLIGETHCNSWGCGPIGIGEVDPPWFSWD